MRVKVTRQTKVIEELRKRIKEASRAGVESGYFPESGIHEESGMHYAELMDLHEHGSYSAEPPIPARPVRLQTMKFLEAQSNVWSESVSRYLRGKDSLSNSLNKIGAAITVNAQSIFGTDRLTPNAPSTVKDKGRNEPLVDSGDLRDAWTWKIHLTESK